MKAPRRKAFDPLLGHLVTRGDTSSARVRNKLRGLYSWCFCDLCWRTTEYSIAIEAQSIFKRIGRGNAKAVPITNAVRDEAQREADLLVERYEKAMAGEIDIDEPAELVMAYCDIVQMRGDKSVASFRDQVERRMLIIAWARHGDLLSVARLPNQPEGSPKPSKFYCEMHNPRRSDEARRAYQRDRSFASEYDELIAAHWTIWAGELPTWDIEAHAEVRKEAFRRLLLMKKPTLFIDELEAKGISSQAEIARHLGVSRQAVSAAIKRRALKAPAD